jgi:hypothetical protein
MIFECSSVAATAPAPAYPDSFATIFDRRSSPEACAGLAGRMLDNFAERLG